MSSEEIKTERNKGIAPIKPEFLIQDHVVEVDPKFVAESSNKKLKGRNRKRPFHCTIEKHDKLCYRFLSDEGCTNENCYFSHNIVEYMKAKPKDISESCHLYNTFGRCHYGVTCRFGSSHLNENNENLTNPQILNITDQKQCSSNFLSKDLQIHLRKKQYDFVKANEVVDHLRKVNAKANGHTLESETKSLHYKKFEDSDTEDSPSIGPCIDDPIVKYRPKEIKKVDFKDKLYLAPLTTVGNLPFRRVCVEYGADITCGEMAMAVNLLQGSPSEWALLRRHKSESLFGVQLCGAHPDLMTKCAQMLADHVDVDFVDINMGCPIDLVCKKGGGCALMGKASKLDDIISGMTSMLSVPLTLKLRTGIYDGKNTAHQLITRLKKHKGLIALYTLHGRSKEQRYSKLANWEYIDNCAKEADPIPFFGCGDILSYEDYNAKRQDSAISGIMLARGALIKPWIFTEIKEQRHWDISSSERFDNLKKYVNYGLEHWGSDTEGVERTRRFLLEWQSFLYRYIPVGLLERLPQKINERPPYYKGRDDLETLMASPSCADWIKLSEMLLGPPPSDFAFLPKHKANAYK